MHWFVSIMTALGYAADTKDALAMGGFFAKKIPRILRNRAKDYENVQNELYAKIQALSDAQKRLDAIQVQYPLSPHSTDDEVKAHLHESVPVLREIFGDVRDLSKPSVNRGLILGLYNYLLSPECREALPQTESFPLFLERMVKGENTPKTEFQYLDMDYFGYNEGTKLNHAQIQAIKEKMLEIQHNTEWLLPKSVEHILNGLGDIHFEGTKDWRKDDSEKRRRWGQYQSAEKRRLKRRKREKREADKRMKREYGNIGTWDD